ncbi:MAG TPA: DUF87 domain-containing protein [Acidimicrobiales bacterium]|nr:DUF87 domain-containing protein [Acidimicrobiales bacterium]
MIDVPAGHLYLGEGTADHERTGEAVLLEASDLTTHGVIVGMTGSGKTGLGVGLIEEALLQGIPTLIVDPKGDLGNLLLTFPDLSAASFEPWVDGGDATAVAASWKEGLAGWGIDGARIQALRDAATLTIYTPGSTSGVGLNVVGSLQRPIEGADDEAVLDEVQGFVSGVLGLVGIDADPLASREHILLSNLVQRAWAAGEDLDLAGLVAQVQSPPLRKLGVFELDEFFPPDDRTKLAMRLNGLLASPAFAAWGEGDALDMERLLRPDGGVGCPIITLAHLSDEERQLVVTLVLSKLVTWMRRQPGTDQLRVLVYFDEVAGYVPPTAAPPSKAPILTLLKQARAFGVGLVLATQNPVDVDYKALSNAGTWMIGRLQTEQDKARLLDGLAAAAGGVDTAAVGDTIAGLDKREFVLRQAGSDAPTTFTTRWAMSYLRGPLTREQIATLMAGRRHATAPAAPRTPPVGITEDATPVMPTVAEGVPVRWLDPAAPWGAQIGATPAGTTYAASIVATVDLLFDDTKADLRHDEQLECVLFPLGDPADVASLLAVDHDPRDLLPEPPAQLAYRLPDAPIKNKTFFTGLQKELVAHLLATRTTTVLANPDLKLYSRPGESTDDFALRCEAAADDAADRAAAAVAKKYDARIARARDAVAVAQDRVEQAELAKSTRRNDELLSGAGDLLGSLLGTRRSRGGIARKVGTIARRRGRTSEASKRVETAANRVGEKAQALADLEADLADELAAIADEWDAKAVAVQRLEIPLERSDIRVADLALVWVPVA